MVFGRVATDWGCFSSGLNQEAVSCAWNPLILWLPSQNGRFEDFPHRHNATANFWVGTVNASRWWSVTCIVAKSPPSMSYGNSITSGPSFRHRSFTTGRLLAGFSVFWNVTLMCLRVHLKCLLLPCLQRLFHEPPPEHHCARQNPNRH